MKNTSIVTNAIRNGLFFCSPAALRKLSVILSILVLAMSGNAHAQAVTLTWDPLLNGTAGTDGGGTWNTNSTANWTNLTADTTWQGTASPGISFTSGQTTITVTANSVVAGEVVTGAGIQTTTPTTITAYTPGATTATISSATTAASSGSYAAAFNGIFGSGGAGGVVTLSGAEVINNLTFNNSGYDLVTSASNTLAVAGATTVNTNVTAQIDGSGASFHQLNLNDGSTLTLTGGGTLNSAIVSSGPLQTGILAVPSGIVNSTGQAIGNVNLTGTGELSGNFANFTGGTINITEPSNPGPAISITGSNSLNLGRGPGVSATLNLTAGTVTTSGGTSTSVIKIGNGNNSSTTGIFNVQGGTVSAIGTGATGIIIDGISATVGNVNTGNGTLALSSGTINTSAIWFGDSVNRTLTVTLNNPGNALLTVTGGNLFIGTGGIVSNVTNQHQVITLSGGTVGALGDWSSSLNTTLGTTNGNITFRTADASAVAHNIGLSGVLSGSGGLNEAGGAGVLTLSAATGNTYAGVTTVNSGILRVTNTSGSGTGTGTVTVNSGGALGGSGFITGSTTINTGGILAPNAGSPSLNGTSHLQFQLATGALTLAAPATSSVTQLVFNLGANTASSDEVVIGSGGLALNGQQFGNFSFNASGATAGTYVLIDDSAGSGIVGNLGAITTGTVAGFNATLSISGSNLDLTLASAVPEPSTWALVILGSFGLMLFNLRRRHHQIQS